MPILTVADTVDPSPRDTLHATAEAENHELRSAAVKLKRSASE